MEHIDSPETPEKIDFEPQPQTLQTTPEEKEEIVWEEKSSDQLTVADIDNLDAAGKDYISNILIYKSFERDPFVSLEDLESTFKKAVAFIKGHDPNATFSQIAAAKREYLRASIRHCLPEGMPVTEDELEFTDSAKEDFKNALVILREQTKAYKARHPDQFKQQSIFGKASSYLKGELGSSASNSELQKMVANQLDLYERLATVENITDADLATPVLFEETDTNVYKTGPLSSAINTGRRIHVPTLTRYLEQRSNELKIPGRALLDRVIDCFGQIAKGEVRVESESNIDIDNQYYKSRTTIGAKSGVYKQFETKSAGKLRVKKE